MKIKNKLYLSAGITIILVAILLSVVLVTSGRVVEEKRRHELMDNVRVSISELDLITYDYLLHREKRMKYQWKLKYKSLEKILDESVEEEGLKSIHADYAAIGNLFSQITANYEERQKYIQEGVSQKKIDIATRQEERFVAQILIASHSIITDASRIAVETHAEEMEAQRLATNMTLILMIILAIIVTSTSLLVAGSIAKPLDKLIKGAEVIGKGNLEHKVEIKTKDEIGELAAAFNQMTQNLKASRDELKKEIVMRKQAEEKINHLNLLLRSVRDVNQLITKENNRDVLLQESCKILTRDKGYGSVWIVLFNEEHKVDFATKSGVVKNFQLLINDLKKGKLSYCVKNALNQPEVLLIDNPKFKCTNCPISGKYEGRSAIAVRLEYNNKVYGLLCARIEKEYLADEEILDLFTEVTDDIAFALYRLELEAAHKKAEEVLQESEEKFRNLVETSTDLVFRLTKTGRIVYISPRVEEQYGYQPDELIGKNLKTTTPVGEVTRAIKALNTIFSGKSLKNFEIKQKHKEGRIIPMEINAVPVYQNGEIVGLQGIMRDITERKQAEEQIKIDLEEKSTLLGELYHRTKNNMQLISSMLRMQSRNIENRVHSGSSGIDYLLDSFKEVINKIKSMSLVHQKLYQAKDLSHINLKEYIKDLLNLLMISYNIQSEKISLKLELDDVFVLIDSAIPLGLVLNELISNVFKHAFPNSKNDEISIRLYKDEDDTINILLSDNGVGIPNDIDLENINTMGLQTAFSLIKHQLKGEVNYETENGLKWHFSFIDNLHKKRV